MKKTIAISLIFLVLSAGAALAGDYALIVNPANGEGFLSSAEAKDIFLGRKTTWKNGTKITIFIQAGAAFHRAAIKDLTGKTPQQFDIFWKKALFTGQGIPPASLFGDAAVIRAVSTEPGAVGYVSAGSQDGGVKVLEVR